MPPRSSSDPVRSSTHRILRESDAFVPYTKRAVGNLFIKGGRDMWTGLLGRRATVALSARCAGTIRGVAMRHSGRYDAGARWAK